MLEQRKRVEELIHKIKEEKDGYELGKPWRHSDHALTCVVPILKTSEDHKREYITIAEAEKVTITDTGNISEAKVKNEEEVPMFIRLGELLVGETQERAVTSSRIVFPGEEVIVPIACVHASKGIREGADLKFEGYAPDKEYSFINNMHNYGRANQGDSWNLDQTYSFKADTLLYKYGLGEEPKKYGLTSSPPEMMYFSGNSNDIDFSSNDINFTYWGDSTTEGTGGRGFTQTPLGSASPLSSQSSSSASSRPSISYGYDDLTAKHKKVNEALGDVIKKVPLFENQVGLALIDPDGFKCLDCYDVKLSYKAVKEALVGKETVAISDKDEENVFEYKPEVAKSTISKVLDNKFEENVVHEEDRTKTITLDLEGYMGEAVLLNHKIIHFILARKE